MLDQDWSTRLGLFLFLTVKKIIFAGAHCSFLRALSFLIPTHHIPFGVTGSHRLFALLEYSLILSLPSWKVK
jgi:hypothetical protein